MKRTTIWLKAIQIKQLKSLARETGAAVASLIRMAIDEFLDRRLKRPGDADTSPKN